ncbi:MAG: MG2 domain-containing protein [Muribaculum sp.]|nr:MG2 domain-containing protein [Muribaculum sp.]
MISISAVPLLGKTKKVSSDKTAKVENTFSNPDFAFPKDVSANAETVLVKSRRTDNYGQALKAAMQLCIAHNLISKDSVVESLSLLKDLAASFPAPYSQLADLLQASIYKDIYSSNPSQFNNRILPADSVPSDPMLWNASMFRNRINSLLSSVLTNIPDDDKTLPLTDFSDVVDLSGFDKTEGYLLYDFLCCKALSILNAFPTEAQQTIPFGDSESANAGAAATVPAMNPSRISSMLLAFHEKINPESVAYGRALVEYALNCTDDASDYLATQLLRKKPSAALIPVAWRYYQTYFQNDWCGYLQYNSAVDDEDSSPLISARDFYALVHKIKAASGESSASSALDNIVEAMSSKGFGFSGNSLIVPEEASVVFTNRRNISDGYLMIYSVPESMSTDISSRKLNEILPQLKIKLRLPFPSVKKQVPFMQADTIILPPLKAGRYVVTASSDGRDTGIYTQLLNGFADVINVSEIDIIALDEPDGKGFVYIVDSRDMTPVMGANVTFVENPGRKNSRSSSVVSDTNGKVAVPYTNCNVRAKWNGSFISDWYGNYRHSYEQKKQYMAKILTDLSIYHPGDSVRFAAIVYSKDNDRFSIEPNVDVDVNLLDANYQKVDSISLRSDKYGRLSGGFNLPKDGLLGYWHLSLNDNDKRRLAFESFNVADYKNPTFFVAVDSISVENSDSVIDIKGMVNSYSGMPVGNASLDYTIDFSPYLYWRRNNPPASFSGKATADAEGCFNISLPCSRLKGTRFEEGAFTLTLTATSPAGETQQAPYRQFSIGSAESIDIQVPSRLLVEGDSVKLTVGVKDMLGHPLRREVKYVIIDRSDSTVKAQGSFMSPNLMVSAKTLASGEYEARFSIEGADNERAHQNGTADFVVWRHSDKIPPEKTQLWVPISSVTASSGKKKIKVKVGASYPDNHILMVVSDKSGKISEKWLQPKGKIIEEEVPVPTDNNITFVNFYGLRDFNASSGLVTVYPASSKDRLQIQTESFRDQTSAGSKETWTFKFLKNGNPAQFTPAMAVMTDKALDALAPFSWNFNPRSYFGIASPLSISSVYVGRFSASTGQTLKLKSVDFSAPEWLLYGYPLYSGAYGRMLTYNVRGGSVMQDMVMMKSESAKLSSANTKEMADEVYLTGSVEDAATPKAEEVVESNASDSEDNLRPAEYPLAFFKPDLITDSRGMLTLDLDMPDFNTTWQLQILGYTPSLLTDKITLTTVASKKVMVSAGIPQFVRTGDNVSLYATLYNNTDAALPIAGKIEIYNPFSDRILAVRTFDSQLIEPSANRMIEMNIDIPSDISSIGIRCFAISDSGSDGEQTVIPVLPSSQPVVESIPFYMTPGDGCYSLAIPENILKTKDANVTLQYCDNPAWFCLTALPDLVVPSSKSVIALSDALFGNLVASGLISSNPQLRKGLELALSSAGNDSLLTSNLQKYGNLKIVTLNNTPWVNNAQSETLRMQNLSGLLNEKEARETIISNWKELRELLCTDGGWSWCPHMKSSLYMTQRVLGRLGNLKGMGYLPQLDDLDKTISDAIRYCDDEYVASWRRYPKGFAPESMLEYLYVRSFFKFPMAEKDFAALHSKAITAIESNWRSFDIYNKATAAVLLYRENRLNTAGEILSSLSQYSSYEANVGRWYDNLNAGWNGRGKLATTAHVLDAFCEINPKSAEIDKIRQWLVLQRQTLDWGNMGETAEVVNSILKSGTEWTNTNTPGLNAEIFIDGRKVEISEYEQLTGTLNLNLGGTSPKTVTINKSSEGPSWGGVISQYIAPMKSVKAASVNDLSVKKDFYILDSNGGVMSASSAKSFKKGDKVRVTITVITQRDMDYIALVDQRPACFIPVRQLSGYDLTGDLWAYRETRTAATSLFFGFMPKGKYVISYDCYVTSQGKYSAGIATVQSQYAPLITAHSAGESIIVN